MGWIWKARDVLVPPSNKKVLRRTRRAAESKKAPGLALAALVLVAGAFEVGQPVADERAPDVSIHSRSEAFAALQDSFAHSANADQPSGDRTPSAAHDPYSALSEFVRVADASGWVPLPAQQGAAPNEAVHAGLHAAASSGRDADSVLNDFVNATNAWGAAPLPTQQDAVPDDAIHARLHGATASGGDAYSVLQDSVKTADASSGEAAAPDDATHAGLCRATASGGEAAAPDDTIHAGLCRATASGGEAAAPDDAIHAGLHGAGAAQTLGAAPDDAIHAGLRADGSGGEASSATAGFAKNSDALGSAAPDNSIHAGLKAAAETGSDDFAALRDFAQTLKTGEPVLVAAANGKRVKVKKAVSAASDDAGGFAKGDPQVCLGCHGQDPHIQAFLKYSPMARKGDQRTPMAAGGCETCHGPSAAHVASRSKGGDVEPAVVFSGPHASPVEQRNEQCMNCHEGGQRINWQGSQMQNDGVACVNCHTVHVAKDPVLVKKTQPNVCFACHQQQRAESLEYSHHPIQEGLVVCSDCHNPHGSAGPHALKEFSVNETCYNCHQDKRGPMLWEHQPVREDCTNCHNPHGSVEARLMKENMGFMCSSCHSAVSNNSGGAFGGAHALPGNLLGRAMFNSALGNQRLCLNCHSQIHGSNSPNGAYFFR